ncbi:MAG: serine/threonine-protein kinase, partial [Thermoguttaceae bacterium]|nr:serine/threonine-protein kinase [Thermoguttaceae bacterium]
MELPTRLDAAVGVLEERCDCPDPRRIDLYQIGVVFYRLLTGDSILAYMYTARGKSRVPASVRPILRGLLGYNPAERYRDCSEAIQAVEAAMAECGQDSAIDPFPFERLGPYRILDRIGSGGMGEVYRGYEEALDRQVAIKVLPAELAQDDQFVRLFRSEAAAAAQVSHPGVVPVYGVGEDRGRHYFAMQYIEGESVAERLARCGRLPLRQALNIAQQCLEALGAAHAHGVIHRDIKPGNLLIEEKTGRVVLVDFGLSARMRDPDGTGHENLFLGTVEYLAPEQIRGDPPDERSDLYSCGAVLYQMLSGQAPTGAETPTGVLFERAYELPRPLSEIAPEVPESVARIVARLMAKDPADRYPSCAEALVDVVAAATEWPARAGRGRQPTPRPQPRRPG